MRDGFNLEGKTFLLTGAAGEIGRSIALICSKLGAEMILIDQNPMGDLCAQLENGGGTPRNFQCDVTHRDQVEDICRRAGPVDGCILNAAISPFDDWMADGWDDVFHRVMAVNIKGPINFARALLPGMQARGWGRIVITGAVAGHTGGGMLAATPPHYVISKGGLHTFTRWLARRAGADICVNAIAPGLVETAMNASQPFIPSGAQIIKRKATVDEIAWPVAFLCSPAASFMTGAILDVNGGVYLR
jgi:3-oxoacyl-[acyl-carrier protein] reductase